MPPIAGPTDEPRQTRFRADHGALTGVDLQTLRCSLRRRAQGQALLLSRPISVHGVRATHMARELADIEACLRAHSTKLYHLGIRGNVARNTLANANATRDWRIYCDFAQRLIGIAHPLPPRARARCLLRYGPNLYRQVDQTAPANQGILRHNRERGEDANLDRRVRLRPRRHRQKRLNCSASLYEMLQILRITMFERTSIKQLL